jgi:LysM repeat protein
MAWNNSEKPEKPEKSDIEIEDEMRLENPFSGWDKNKRLGIFGDLLTSPFVWAGTALVILIIMAMIFWPGENDKASSENMDNIAQRMDMLENRIFIAETNLQNLSIQQPQEQNLESFQNRIEQLEAFVKHKTDQFTSDLENAQKQIASLESKRSPSAATSKPSASRPVASKPASAEKPATARTSDTARFHTVKKGETLYRISINYGISVDKLLDLNDMSKNSVIYPGQKLKVSP